MSAETQQLTVGIIGLGRMGLRHVDVVKSLGMKVVGLADINPDAIAAAKKDFDLTDAAGYTDPQQLIADVPMDGLVVSTTAPFHAEAVITAAKAGTKRILCEKPIGVSIDEGKAMIAACRASGTLLAINHQMRFMEQYTRIKEIVNSPELGGLASIVVSASNFGLAMNGSHYFEMFRYMTGCNVDRLSAWFEAERLPNPRGPQFDDASGRLVAFNDAGQSFYLDYSAQAGWGIIVNYICRHGQVTVDELSGEYQVKSRRAEFRELPTSRYGMPVDTLRSQLQPADSVGPTRAVWQALLTGADYPTGEDGLHALKCLVAAHLSDRRGGAMIKLSDTAETTSEVFGWA